MGFPCTELPFGCGEPIISASCNSRLRFLSANRGEAGFERRLVVVDLGKGPGQLSLDIFRGLRRGLNRLGRSEPLGEGLHPAHGHGSDCDHGGEELQLGDHHGGRHSCANRVAVVFSVANPRANRTVAELAKAAETG